jgi:MYXO-CTERM domain-containing protein
MPQNRDVRSRRVYLLTINLLLACAASSPAAAAPEIYTDKAAFLAALPGPEATLDFDEVAAGTLLPNGSALGGITFSYDFGGVQLLISDVFDTTSAPNFLGTDDGSVLQDGDDFTLGFEPRNAVGMYFIAADQLLDGDIELAAGGAAASLVAEDVQQILGDGSSVFFLGIVDTADAFSTADVTTIGGEFFLYNVDDIVTAVPEPGASSPLALALVAVLAAWRRRLGGFASSGEVSASPSGMRAAECTAIHRWYTRHSSR